MAILGTLADKVVVRITRDTQYESEFLRQYFKKKYRISVGKYSAGFFDRWRVPPGTTIGRYSTIASTVRLLDANHPTRALSTHPYFYASQLGFVGEDKVHSVPPIIEDDVWMGHNSISTPECKRIGRGAIVGAGAVVMSDVPRYAIVIGSPAKVVRFRFAPDVIEAVEATEWWLLDKVDLKRALDAVPEFLVKPSVESAQALMRALGRSYQKREATLANEKADFGPGQTTPQNDRIVQLLRSQLPAFSPREMNTPFEDLAIDSLGLLNLRTALEQSFGARISNSDWGEVSSPADLSKYVSSAVSTQRALSTPGAPHDNRLVELIRNEVPTFSPSQMTTPFEDLAIDSLGLLNLRTALEQSLGARISNSKWGEISRPADLLKYSPAVTSIDLAKPIAITNQIRESPGDHTFLAGAPAKGRPETELYWLPEVSDCIDEIESIEAAKDSRDAWRRLVKLAGKKLDFMQTNRVDAAFRRHFDGVPPQDLDTKPVRLAMLGSSTLTHLLPAVRVGALRRGIFVTIHDGDYGQYLQELSDRGSELYAFQPTAILLALDAFHLTRGIDASADEKASEAALQETLSHLRTCWRLAREARIATIQQTALPVFSPILGNNEHRLPGSKQRVLARLNEMLRAAADQEGVELLAIDSQAAMAGVSAWHDPILWHRAKQEISPVAAPLYGDLVARLLAAQQGRSFKCLVLDLDNTLWGGVIGDDGLEGIVVGQGNAAGEAFLETQNYALQLAKRGVILAVCSKNDEPNALAPFHEHPEMTLKRSDIASFVANWDDKTKNLRRIAKELNIGLDSLVFLDDNPFERNLVRSELPMVAVPELPEDPALFARTVADAGYFEGIRVTDEDRERTQQYQINSERSALQAESADLPTYLRGLGMELIWKPFDAVGLQRIVQLINKTNQFNLTTRRYTESDILAVLADPNAFGLQLRLIDRYGDNGIIAIAIGKRNGDNVEIDTWLMSCRVLGRQVEQATLGLIVDMATRYGAKRIVGLYTPTAKNGMVRDHYEKLGFTLQESNDNGETRWMLDCSYYHPTELYMELKQG